MPKLYFHADISPQAIGLNFNSPEFTLITTEGKFSMKYLMHIKNSALTMECDLEESYRHEDISQIYAFAFNAVRRVINIYGFSKGVGIFVNFIAYTDSDGNRVALNWADPELAACVTAFSVSKNLTDIFEILGTDDSVSLALNDLILALKEHSNIAMDCARAMEGIRYAISPLVVNDDAQAWTNMHAALRVERSYIDLITSNAKPHRHGRRVFIPPVINREILRRAWTIMNRYVEWRKLGRPTLPEQQFPWLKDEPRY